MTPVPAKLAATVILLRPAGNGFEVFLQRRVRQMSFAGGMTVFPGGGVDPGDAARPTDWSGPTGSWWAEHLQMPAEHASALVCAAVRETFEECGVLLASGHDDRPVPPEWLATARTDLLQRRRSLAELLAEQRLTLRADLLFPWARWITPITEPKRYDTVFFVAQLPAEQQADAHTSEAVEADWWTPERALRAGRTGELQLMPPTEHNLTELGAQPSLDAVVQQAADRFVRRVEPRIEVQNGRRVVIIDEVGRT